MGKITGFMELQRIAEVADPVNARVRHYREFIHALDDEAASKQGARCMDCGIPFCQSGCPVNNIIPDWNDLVYRHQWKDGARRPAFDEQLPGVHRPRSAPRRAKRRARSTSTTIRWASSRSSTSSSTRDTRKAGSFPFRRRARRASASRSSARDRRALRARSNSRAPATTSCCSKRRSHRRTAALRHSRFQDGEALDRPADGADVDRRRRVSSRLARRRQRRRRARCWPSSMRSR